MTNRIQIFMLASAVAFAGLGGAGDALAQAAPNKVEKPRDADGGGGRGRRVSAATYGAAEIDNQGARAPTVRTSEPISPQYSVGKEQPKDQPAPARGNAKGKGPK